MEVGLLWIDLRVALGAVRSVSAVVDSHPVEAPFDDWRAFHPRNLQAVRWLGLVSLPVLPLSALSPVLGDWHWNLGPSYSGSTVILFQDLAVGLR